MHTRTFSPHFTSIIHVWLMRKKKHRWKDLQKRQRNQRTQRGLQNKDKDAESPYIQQKGQALYTKFYDTR